MGIAELTAFIKALPLLVEEFKAMRTTLNQIYVDKKNSELDQFKGEIYAELDKIILAKNDNDRKNSIVALSKRLAGKRV